MQIIQEQLKTQKAVAETQADDNEQTNAEDEVPSS